MQALRAWYYYSNILFKSSTPLHQMGILDCQIKLLWKDIYFSRIKPKYIKNITKCKIHFGCGIKKAYVNEMLTSVLSWLK